MLAFLPLLVLAATPIQLGEVKFDRYPAFAELKGVERDELLRKEVLATLIKAMEPKAVEVRELEGAFVRRLDIRLRSLKQENRSRADLLNDPNRGGSRTEVTVDITFDGSASKGLKGWAKGPYFGTTRRRDLDGTPDAEDLAVQLVNRQRARAVGQAIANALVPVLAP
jgi:hypothetical protein